MLHTTGFGYAAAKIVTEGDTTGATRSHEIDTAFTLSGGAISARSTTTKDSTGTVYRSLQDSFALGVSVSGGIASLWNVSNIRERDALDGTGATVRSTKLYYDGSTTLGAVTQGKVTKRDALSSGSYVTKASYAWDAYGNLSSFADNAGHTSSITFDSTYHLFPISTSNALSQTNSATYDADYAVTLSSTNSNSISKYYSYDALMRLATISGPLASGVSPDPSHPTVAYSYAFGNPETSTPSSILTTKLTNIGETTTISTESYFDSLGRPIAVVHQGPTSKFVHEGGTIYNAQGQVVEQFLPFFVSDLSDYSFSTSRKGTQTSFDVLGRPLQIVNPQSTSSSPSLKTIAYKVGEEDDTDENAHTSKKYFDVFGRLQEFSDAKSYSTTMAYDSLDELTSISDAKGEVTQLTYDSLGRRTCKFDTNLGKIAYSYSDLDLVSAASDYGFEAGVTSCSGTNSNTPRSISFTYDTLNRMTGETAARSGYSDSIGLTYDTATNGVGKIAGATFKIGSKAFSYDTFGNVGEIDYNIAGSTGTLVTKYDVLGRVREVDYPQQYGDVFDVGYTFDAAGNIASVYNIGTSAVYANNFAYNERNQLLDMQYGNGVWLRQTYDSDGGSYRLNDIMSYTGSQKSDSAPVSSICDSSAFQCLSYSYDAASNVTGIVDYVTDPASHSETNKTFTYDEKNQLTDAAGQWGDQAFTYDEIGNITSKNVTAPVRKTGIALLDKLALKLKSSVPGINSTTAYTYDSTRQQILTGVGSDSYTFDPWGNVLTQPGSRSYYFTGLNYLDEMDAPEGTYRFWVDENGERLENTTPSGGGGVYMSKYYARLQGQFKYIYAGDRLIASYNDYLAGMQYYHPDHLGSINYITNGDPSITLHQEYGPFGDLVSTAGAGITFLGFSGTYYDSGTGLNYFGSRYYLSGVGRWTSADPMYSVSGAAPSSGLDVTQRVSLWDYGANSPMVYRDSSGRFLFPFATAFYGGVAGGMAGYLGAKAAGVRPFWPTFIGSVVGGAVGAFDPYASAYLGGTVAGLAIKGAATGFVGGVAGAVANNMATGQHFYQPSWKAAATIGASTALGAASGGFLNADFLPGAEGVAGAASFGGKNLANGLIDFGIGPARDLLADSFGEAVAGGPGMGGTGSSALSSGSAPSVSQTGIATTGGAAAATYVPPVNNAFPNVIGGTQNWDPSNAMPMSQYPTQDPTPDSD